MLSIGGSRILFDCPLDLSALTIFSPVPTDFNAPLAQETPCLESDVKKRQKRDKYPGPSDLIHAEPWYKTVTNLHLWNPSFIDIVLISSPMGMLGLPFLSRMKGFSAKVWECYILY